MALIMLLSLAPVGALATEDEGQPAENQAVAQSAVVDEDKNTPTEPTKDSDSAEATKSEGGLDEDFNNVDADTSSNDNGIAVQNFSNGRAAEEQTITAEYWVTNARVTAQDNQSLEIQATDSRITSETGASVETLAPETGTQEGNNVIFWQARVLSGEDKQTDGGGVDSTSKGKEIQSIRYYNSMFSYQEKGNDQWTEFTITNGKVQEQLVFYYMIKADFEQNVSVAITDWPNTSENQIPQGAPSPHQVNYEVWKLEDEGADLGNAERLGETVPTYYNSALTISAIKVSMNENEQYYIQSIKISDTGNGSYTEPTVTRSQAEFALNLATAGNSSTLIDNAVITIKIYVTAYKYELAYQTNEGRINDPSYSRAGYYLPNISINTPINVTKTGYTFAGWYTDEECTEENKWTTDSTMPSEKLTLYAKWNENNYMVNYDLNYDGAQNPTDRNRNNVHWNDANLLPSGSFTREGYIFDGWYTQSTGGEKVTDTTTYANIAKNDTNTSVTLYAHWNQNSEPTTESTPVYVYFKIVDAAGNNIKDKSKINNDDLKKTVYNKEADKETWATLGKIASAATLENGEKYTGTNATLKTVGNEATAKLKGNALHDSNKEIVNKVLANIEWFQLKQWAGATDYVSDGSRWHLDGKITGYTVTYNNGTTEATDAVHNMPDADDMYYLRGSEYTVSDATPTREGYVFTGWKSNIENDTTIYNAKGKFEMPAKNVVLTAQWEKDELVDPSVDQPEGITKGDGIADKYQIQVSFKAVNGTFKNGENSITEYTTVVTKYDNSTNNPSENGTAKLAAAHLKTATPNEGHKLTGWTKNDTGCDAPGVGTPVQNNDYFVVTFAQEEKPPIVEPITKIKYTINQHFMDGKGKERDDLRVNGNAQMKPKGTPLSDLIEGKTGPQSKNKNYVYVSSKTTYTVDQVTNPLNADSKLTKDTTIDLYYYLDNWKDGDEAGKDSENGGDNIPDCYQVLVKYQSGDLRKGKIADTARTQEVLTIRGNDKQPTNKGTVQASGSTAEATGSRNYFSNWTDKDNTQVGTNATLEAWNIENAEGGTTYTFTANFYHRSGGGGSRPSTPTVTIPDDVPTGLNGKDHYAYIIGYGNNDVRPQNNITRAEVATIFFRLLTDETREANMTKSNGYNDVKDGDWFCCAVSTLSKMGIIKGYEDGSFKPNDPISRAEFAAIAARFDPDGDKTPASFADVSSHWAKDEISIAANHGWIKGYEDGSFKPDQKITRAETMTLVNRVLNRLPEAKDDLHKDMKTWVDNMDETAWYYLAVQEATNSHYFKNKTGTKFEQWTDLRDTRDWSELEK